MAVETRREARRGLLMDAAILTVGAFLVRLANLDHTPMVDEFNHLIAAASLLREGAPLLESGWAYTRAQSFTWMVAASFAVFGESLVAARIPALLAGTLLVTVLFLWVRTAVGRWEAWTAAVLLLLAPEAIYHSQLARMYGLQALFVVGSAWSVFELARIPTWRTWKTWALAGLALACALGAVAMQISSLGALSAICAWGVLALGWGAYLRGAPPKTFLLGAMAIGAAAAGVFAWLHLTGTLEIASRSFGTVGIWAEDHRDNVRFYHDHYLSRYPLLWAPFPILALLALCRKPGPASLWLMIFLVVFVAQTLAGWKSDRFIFYILPYFFALTGVVAGPLLRRIHLEIQTTVLKVLKSEPGKREDGFKVTGSNPSGARGWKSRETLARTAATGLLSLGLLFAAWGNSAFPYTARMVLGSDASWPFELSYRGEADWAALAASLEDDLPDAEVVVTSTEQAARYFTGRGELILSVNYMGRDTLGSPNPEFSRNHKTGIPVISLPASVEAVVACHRSGIFLIEARHWRRDWSVDEATATRIEALAMPVDLDPGWRILGFAWDHGEAYEEGEAGTCAPFRGPGPG